MAKNLSRSIARDYWLGRGRYSQQAMRDFEKFQRAMARQVSVNSDGAKSAKK
jgi:hypothetical protein